MTEKYSYPQKVELYNYLTGFITQSRKNRFEEIAAQRTRYITIVLEDIYQPHNASAVLRTCDCFGVQDVHIIENRNKYQVNPDVALGASNWLSLHYYNKNEDNTEECLITLKQKGYRIMAATPHIEECQLDEIDLSTKTAVLFGTEMKGLSEIAMQLADGYFKIPMSGFTESFNISVSAAISLYSVTSRLRKSEFIWQLEKDENIDLMLDWARKSIKDGSEIEKIFLEMLRKKSQ